MNHSHRTIGILGGTFDPIHNGHLRVASEVLDTLGLDEMRFVPCRIPPHRQAPVATADQRLEMVRSAVADEPRFVVDTREFDREGPSYSVDTLLELREEMPDTALCLVIGMDQFQSLTQWDRWRSIPELAHIAVMRRPGWHAPAGEQLHPILATGLADGVRRLETDMQGGVVLVTVTPMDISSTEIRALAGSGQDLNHLVPDSVRLQMVSSGCYEQTGV